MEGYVAAPAGLKKDVEAGLLAETEPELQRALAALELGDLEEAKSLARDVLQCYPGHQKAREIVSLIGSSKEATEIARLWEKYARAAKNEEKIDLLAKLLDHDRDNVERIKVLMAEVKADQKKKLVAGRLDELRSLAARRDWPECYPILHWLSIQKEHCEEYRGACSLSAYFAVLYRNRRLRMLPERAAKELWLEFVQAKSSLASGQEKGCFQIMDGIKEYFQPYPEFREDYLMLLGIERERAREEIVLVGLGERCAFYNYSNNKISSPFSIGSVICTRPAKKYYCFDYQKESLELTLRDITPEIGDLLEWEEVAVALGERASSDEQAETLYRQIYFGYQPTGQEEEEKCDEA